MAKLDGNAAEDQVTKRYDKRLPIIRIWSNDSKEASKGDRETLTIYALATTRQSTVQRVIDIHRPVLLPICAPSEHLHMSLSRSARHHQRTDDVASV